jgi:tetratricopeptide (TPR) repeat protein
MQASEGIANSIREPSAPWRDALWIVLLSPVLIAGCYSAGFLEYDDIAHYRHELMDVPLSDTFRASENSTYFPVTVLSYRFDRWLYERTPPGTPLNRSTGAPGVRVNSLLLHMLAGIFLWRALLHLRLGRWLSLFAALAWTVHPTACESVCWISERKNVLAACFGFASLWVYFGRLRDSMRFVLTGFLFVLAMLSKPTAAGFLPVYVLFDLFCFMQRWEGTKNESLAWAGGVVRGLFYLLLMAVIVGLAQVNMSKSEASNSTRAGGGLWTVALTDVPVLWDYIAHSLVPTGLSIFYHNPIVTSLWDKLFWIQLALISACVAVSLILSPDRWRTLFLWGWFVGALGPALNIIPLPFLMQDRYAYFALPAILVIFAETLSQLFLKLAPAPTAQLPRLAALAGAAGFALLAFFRSGTYRNDMLLFQDAVANQPASAHARMFYALTLSAVADKNELANAADVEVIEKLRIEALAQAVASMQCDDFNRVLDPGRVRILEGVLKERLGHDAEAFRVLIKEMLKPQKPFNNVIACQSLARIALRAGHGQEALDWVERGIAAVNDPQPSPEMLYLKGLCLEQLKRLEQARDIYASIPQNSFAFPRAQKRLATLRDTNK